MNIQNTVIKAFMSIFFETSVHTLALIIKIMPFFCPLNLKLFISIINGKQYYLTITIFTNIVYSLI